MSAALPEQRAHTPRSMASPSDHLERAYRLYRKRIARCRTENQLNHVHIALANYMTPEELRFFDAALAQDPVGSPDRRWISKLSCFIPPRESWPAEFRRKGILKSMTLYAADSGSRAEKTLIIGFTGAFNRMMLPLPLLLGCLNPTLYDVVVLSDFSRRFFSMGIPGLGVDFFQALCNLRNHVDPTAYRNCVALGTSSGGLPAVLGAILLKLNRGVSIGGLDFPQFAAKLRDLGASEEPYAALLASRPEPFPELLLVFGGGNATDVVAARGLHGRVPSRLVEVKACDDHVVLRWKLLRGRLPTFFSTLLGQSVETGERIGQAEE
jgi:hypothetical protein